MKIPFCPDCQVWNTPKDRTVTLSEYLASTNWNGNYLDITGSQPKDYAGASSLFRVTMSRELAEKFFGHARVFTAELHNVDEINVADKAHLIEWALANGIEKLSDLRKRYGEYQHLFPRNCIKPTSRVRISA